MRNQATFLVSVIVTLILNGCLHFDTAGPEDLIALPKSEVLSEWIHDNGSQSGFTFVRMVFYKDGTYFDTISYYTTGMSQPHFASYRGSWTGVVGQEVVKEPSQCISDGKALACTGRADTLHHYPVPNSSNWETSEYGFSLSLKWQCPEGLRCGM